MRMKALFHKRVHGKEADVFFYYDIAEIPNISAVAFSSILSHICQYLASFVWSKSGPKTSLMSTNKSGSPKKLWAHLPTGPNKSAPNYRKRKLGEQRCDKLSVGFLTEEAIILMGGLSHITFVQGGCFLTPSNSMITPGKRDRAP